MHYMPVRSSSKITTHHAHRTKTIVILGAAGLVGSNLVCMLVKKSQYTIIAVDKNIHNLRILKHAFPKVTTLCEDVTRPGTWEHHLTNSYAVVQLQAQISSPYPQRFVRNNITSVKHVLAACKRQGVTNLIHASSSVVISVANDDYTKTKRVGEKLVNKSTVPHTILRPALMYGCFDAKHLGWLTRLMERIPLVYPIPGNGKYMRQPLYVLDFCRIIIVLLERKPEGKTYNIIGRERIDYIDLMRIIAKTRGIHRTFVKVPIPVLSETVRAYGLLNKAVGKQPPFIPDQLHALIAGDDFPIEQWWKEFDVSYTPFRKAMKEVVKSPYDKYSKLMINPN